MLDAKDVARKVVAGCNHNAPVIVPCAGCIEGQIRAWETSLRDDVRFSLREEWKAMESETKRVGDRNKELIYTIDKMRVAHAKLEDANKSLMAQLMASKTQIADLKMCLDVEQGNKIRDAQAAKVSKLSVAQ